MTSATGSALVHVAFEVCTALERAGTTAVLTGGSAATFYASEAYQSVDIDFVVTMLSQAGGDGGSRIDMALIEDWCKREGDPYRFRDFVDEVAASALSS